MPFGPWRHATRYRQVLLSRLFPTGVAARRDVRRASAASRALPRLSPHLPALLNHALCLPGWHSSCFSTVAMEPGATLFGRSHCEETNEQEGIRPTEAATLRLPA